MLTGTDPPGAHLLTSTDPPLQPVPLEPLPFHSPPTADEALPPSAASLSSTELGNPPGTLSLASTDPLPLEPLPLHSPPKADVALPPSAAIPSRTKLGSPPGTHFLTSTDLPLKPLPHEPLEVLACTESLGGIGQTPHW